MQTRLLRFFKCVYATSQKKNVYHIVGQRKETLCGQKVLPIVFSEPKGPGLHLISEKPIGMKLCKHCARIERKA